MRDVVFWSLIGLQGLGVLVTIGTIGKPREPRSPAEAVIGVFLTALVVLGYVVLWR